MPPKPDSPIEPFKRAVAATILFTGLFLTCISISHACTFVKAPLASQVQFSNWVLEAQDIALVRVIDARKIVAGDLPEKPDVDSESSTFKMWYYRGTHRFLMQTIEVIKGLPPEKFVALGEFDSDIRNSVKNSLQGHHGLGAFWMRFEGYCASLVGPPTYAPGFTYLIFRHANGVAMYLEGRGAEIISSASDPWLSAIKRLAHDAQLKKGRQARLEDLLVSADAIFVSEVHDCGGNRYGAVRRRVIRHLWGSESTASSLTNHYDDADNFGGCLSGSQTLRIALSSDPTEYVLDLVVDPKTQTVDFGGMLDGTQMGLSDSLRDSTVLWYSQIDFSGPRVWALNDLERALKSYEPNNTGRN
ncbi:MAG: hypothetical protein SGJ03_16355 [Alphaproteobacteria bacterium]|nr:hypothetical protein [Alphaproteobacteria bacterium]